jgi:2-succinyl-5-enolpyruvyl-6-hydroxy-3-cyclohexene-1-carboxylate synthase
MPTPHDPLDAENVTYRWTQCLVEELVRQGVDTFFVAPGSRSTPLTVAVARHPSAQAVLHIDERGTAFAALGYGRATGRPAGWITTSGTAVANGLPAVVEAHTDGVPLVLLTADRPPELRDSGANQTIDQVKIFDPYVTWQADVPVPSDDVDPAYVLTTADRAVHHALRAPRGPVHLNAMFRKPLEPVGEHLPGSVPDAVRAWASSEVPYSSVSPAVPSPSESAIDALASAVEGVERGLIVLGRLDAPSDAVRELAEHLNWPVLPDVTSQHRLGPTDGRVRIAFHDALLAHDEFAQAHAPEAVLHMGGRHVSKRLRLFLRDAAPRVRAVVRPDPRRLDPDHRVTHHVESTVDAAAAALRTQCAPQASMAWRDAWYRADRTTATALQEALDADSHLTEPRVSSLLPRLLPPDHALVLASSMPVRDVHRFGRPSDTPTLAYANRGASGIDGTVATAAGVAHGRERPVTLLIGDLALGHDVNSLALLRDVPVIVVCLNNDGGGIFHFLPIRDDATFDPYFTTPQGRTFEAAADLYDVAYAQPTTVNEFMAAYRTACASGASALIEVGTDRAENRALHDDLDDRVCTALAESS